MKKALTIFAALFLALTAIIKNANASETEAKKFSLYATTGKRTDNLSWSISGFNQIYNIGGNLYSLPTSSELSWKDIKIIQTTIGANVPLASFEEVNMLPKGDLFLNGFVSYGKIVKGNNQDSDFLHIGQENIEFSRSNNDAKSGDVRDYSLSLNYQIPLENIHLSASKIDNYSITPIVGYAANEQNLTMTNGNKTVDLTTPVQLGSFAGLDSSYSSKWQGPFVGLAFNTNLSKKHNLEILAEYHLVDYRASANWNLRSDFNHPKSFEHEANGNGKVIGVKYSFKPHQNISYNISADYKKFSTGAGIDRTFFNNGVVSEVTLDKVNWDSKALNIGIGYEF